MGLAQDRICICNAPHYSCTTASAGDVVEKPGLFGGGSAAFGFHLKGHELGQVADAAVTDQVGGSDAQPGMQWPGVAHNHVARAEGVGQRGKVPGGDAGGGASPAGADVVPEEADRARAVGQKDPLLSFLFAGHGGGGGVPAVNGRTVTLRELVGCGGGVA